MVFISSGFELGKRTEWQDVASTEFGVPIDIRAYYGQLSRVSQLSLDEAHSVRGIKINSQKTGNTLR